MLGDPRHFPSYFRRMQRSLSAGQLPPAIAQACLVERGADRMLLSVTLLRKMPDGRTTPVDGTVAASAYHLNGQLKDQQTRRISGRVSVCSIGEVGISGEEILVFDIDATPVGQAAKFQVQFRREFFAD
jgi:hypothetical protein